jgi:predicted nucleic acid-binding protein
MPSSVICCDASLIVRLITAPDESEVVARWTKWKDSRAEFVAPRLLKFELVNAFHRMRTAGEISPAGCAAYLDSAFQLPILFDDSDRVHFEALSLAFELGMPAAYDAHYLAVSISHNAEFWTFDRKLHHAAAARFDWVFLAS